MLWVNCLSAQYDVHWSRGRRVSFAAQNGRSAALTLSFSSLVRKGSARMSKNVHLRLLAHIVQQKGSAEVVE